MTLGQHSTMLHITAFPRTSVIEADHRTLRGLDDPAFVKLIRQRVGTGVDVKIIGKAAALEKELPVRQLKGMKLHVRAMIRDATHVFVGSQSLRRLELDSRREVGLIITNPTAARRMQHVFEEEPAVHPGLIGLPNVVLAPHIASASRATRVEMARLAVENCLSVLEGKAPPTPVNGELLQRR